MPVDGCHAAAIFDNISDFDALLHGCATLARAFGEGEGNVGWVSLTIKGEVNAACDTFDVEMFVALFNFGRRNFFDLNTESAGHGGGAVQLFEALACEGCCDGADALKAGGDACFFLKVAVKLLGVFRELGHIGRGA